MTFRVQACINSSRLSFVCQLFRLSLRIPQKVRQSFFILDRNYKTKSAKETKFQWVGRKVKFIAFMSRLRCQRIFDFFAVGQSFALVPSAGKTDD